MPEASIQQIFEPYFTTKQKGSGLGLATAYSIIRNHGGHIAVQSEMGVGSTFTIYLPTSSEGPLTAMNVEEGLPVGKGRILVMDDEDFVRELAGNLLERLGYQVGFATGGFEAAQMYREAMNSNEPYAAVLMDLTIRGGMGGKESIKRLLHIDPAARAIVISGYSNDPVMSSFVEHGFKGMVRKPYDIMALGRELQRVLAETGE